MVDVHTCTHVPFTPVPHSSASGCGSGAWFPDSPPAAFGVLFYMLVSEPHCVWPRPFLCPSGGEAQGCTLGTLGAACPHLSSLMPSLCGHNPRAVSSGPGARSQCPLQRIPQGSSAWVAVVTDAPRPQPSDYGGRAREATRPGSGHWCQATCWVPLSGWESFSRWPFTSQAGGHFLQTASGHWGTQEGLGGWEWL